MNVNGYNEAEAHAWLWINAALGEYLRVQAKYVYVRDWQVLIDEMVDDIRLALTDAILPQVMQDVRGIMYTGDNQSEGSK